MPTPETTKVVSLYWGYSIGGVGKYGVLIDGVSRYEDIELKHVCILSDSWQCDTKTLDELDATIIRIKSRLDFSWIAQVGRYLAHQKADAVFTHGFNGHVVALLTKLLGFHKITLLASYHGLYHGTTSARKLISPIFNKFTEFYIKRCAAGIISVSDYSKTYLLNRGAAGSKIAVIHNGIENKIYDNANATGLRAEWGIAESECLLGVASRIDPVKGIGYLIEAMPELLRTKSNYRLVVVGVGTEELSLKARCKVLGIADKVLFTGFRSDIEDCLQAFDIFLLPSLAEYHSIGLLEAMRATKKIVATNVGGNTESVRHLQEGYIVSPANSQQIIEAVTFMVDNPSEAAKLASNARARFEQEFVEDVMIKRTASWLVSRASDSGSQQ